MKRRWTSLAAASGMCPWTFLTLALLLLFAPLTQAALPPSDKEGSGAVTGEASVVPVANFTWFPAFPRAQDEIQFTDTSTGTPTRWLWEFDGNGLSTEKNPRHTFTRARSFQVTLTALSSGGSSTTFKTVTVMPAIGAPIPSFTWTPLSPKVGEEVQFTDTSTGAPFEWVWTFDDNGFSTGRNPRHTFREGGSYGVRVTATSSVGSSSATRMVTVTGAPGSPVPKFEWSPLTPKVEQEVSFTDTSTGNPTSRSWAFGDGESGSALNSKHSFRATGEYIVKLTSRNANGSNFITKGVTVGDSSTVVIPKPPGVIVDGIEVTQAIQNLLNEIPLIADKRTFVRAHVRAQGASPVKTGVTLTVVSSAGTNSLVDVWTIPVDGTANPAHAKTLEIPRHWLGTTTASFRLTFQEAEVVECGTAVKSNGGCDAARSASSTAFELRNRRLEKIRLVPIRWTDTNGVTHEPSNREVIQAVLQLEALLPTGSFLWESAPVLVTEEIPSSQASLMSIILDLINLKLSDLAHLRAADNYVGLLADRAVAGATTDGIGGGWTGVAVAFLYDTKQSCCSTTVTHEVAHLLQQKHTLCSGEELNSERFPNPDARISASLDEKKASYGFVPPGVSYFDPNRSEIQALPLVDPTVKDLMAYCYPRWMSDWRYQRILNVLDSTTLAGTASGALAGTPERVAVITGVAADTTSAVIRSVRITTGTADSTDPTGAWTLSATDAVGSVVASRRFSTHPLSDLDSESEVFAIVLPFPERAVALTLQHNSAVIASRRASPNSPVIHLTSPPGDASVSTVHVAWEAVDLDGDALTYIVEYSADGGATWSTVSPNGTKTRAEISTRELTPTLDGRVRVTVSDGLNQASVVSQRFSVVRTPPDISIHPISPSVVAPDSSVIVSGVAVAAGGIPLTGESLTWHLDGVWIGTGESVAFYGSELSAGVHEVRLTAIDAGGVSAEAKAEFWIRSTGRRRTVSH